MATCSHCGQKGLFLKVDEHGLCPDCAQRRAAYLAKKEAERKQEYTPKVLAAFNSTRILDFATCSIEDIQKAIAAVPAFLQLLHQPGPSTSASLWYSYTNHWELDTFDPSSIVKTEENVLAHSKELSEFLESARAYESLITQLPTAGILPDLAAVPSKVLMSDIPEIKISNITSRTSVANVADYIVVDVETTGLSPSRDEVVQLSAVRFEGFEPVEAFDTLVRPRKGISVEATQVNGISEADVANAPYIEQVISDFDSFISAGLPIVGHNIEFDYKFLGRVGSLITRQSAGMKFKFYDTLSLTKRTYPDYQKYNLDYLFRHIYGIVRNNAHNSLSDCVATGLLFEQLCKERIDAAP